MLQLCSISCSKGIIRHLTICAIYAMNNIELSQSSCYHAKFTVIIISSFNSLNSLLIKDDALIGLVYLLIRRKLFICIKSQRHITRDVHFFIIQSKRKIPLLSFTICKFLHEMSFQT